MPKPRKDIHAGQEYGWLTVLGEAPRDSFGHIRWRVKCRCGNEYDVQTGILSKNDPKCRECYISSSKGPRPEKRLSKPGDVINGWEILKEVGKNEYGGILYNCRCPVCGTESVHTRGELIMRKGSGCQYCPPDYHFEFHDGIAIGILPGGQRFKIDAAQAERVSEFHWNLRENGYILRVDSSLPKMMLHWFVLGLEVNHPYPVDHINRDKTDCTSANLRIVTNQQNAMNKSIQKNNTTGYVGVCFVPSKKTYLASIGFNNRKICLGYSNDPVECAKRYNYASELLFGEYAGHRNDVPEADAETRKNIKEKCRPYLAQAIIARQPAVISASA